MQPKVEPELAFLKAEDLVGPGVDLHRVLAATRAVVPAIEVIDSRIAEWQIGWWTRLRTTRRRAASYSATRPRR